MSIKDNGKVTIGVGLAPLVSCKKNVKIGEKVQIQYISGLTYDGVTWTPDNGNTIIKTNSNNTVVFQKSGIYQLIVKGHLQHSSYNICVE